MTTTNPSFVKQCSWPTCQEEKPGEPVSTGTCNCGKIFCEKHWKYHSCPKAQRDRQAAALTLSTPPQGNPGQITTLAQHRLRRNGSTNSY